MFLDTFLTLGLIMDKFRLLYGIYLISSGYLIFSLTIELPFGIYSLSFDPPIGHIFVILSYFIYLAFISLYIYDLEQRDPKGKLEGTIYFGSILSLLTLLFPKILFSVIKFPTLGGTYDYLLLSTQLLFLLALLPFCLVLWLCTNEILHSQESTSLNNTIFKVTEKYGKEILSFPIFYSITYSVFEIYFLIITNNIHLTSFLILGGAILSLIGYLLLFTNYAKNEYLYYIIITGGGLISVGVVFEISLYPSITLWLIFFPTVILITTCLVRIIDQIQKSA